jgi:sulfite reductase beta subunit-like hemoprotein
MFDVEDLERFMGRFSLGRDSNPLETTGSPHFLRIKIPGGFLNSTQLRSIADMAKTYSKGYTEITNRQDIQLHWIEAEHALTLFAIMDDLGFTTDMCGQGFSGARYGDARNIICCPTSGIVQKELINGAPLLHKLSDFLIGNPEFQDMPRKFKFAISGCGCDCTRAITNDLAFVAVQKSERVGYTVLAGGSVGSSLPGPRLAHPLGIFVPPEDAFEVALASIELHREYSSRERKAKARFKWLVHTWGHAKLVSMLEEKLGKHLEKYTGPSFSRRDLHEGFQHQNQTDYSFINIPIQGGILSSDDLMNLANVADTYGNSEIRLTPTQNVILPYIANQTLCLNAINKLGFSLEGSQLRCFSRDELNQAGFRIHVSGCPNNCCANLISEIGLAGRLSREDGVLKQYYDILLGGSYGATAIQGRVIQENVPVGDIVPRLEQLVTNYSQNKHGNETLGEFCNRHSIHALNRTLDPSGG